MIIVAVSGGKASAWCADWAIRTYGHNDVQLYFNDTHWEDPDLYRFLIDLSGYLDHPIINDSDGRSPEQLFYDEHALANDRMPFCSRILKANRLQEFYSHGDQLVFGIGLEEKHRASRITNAYERYSDKKGKRCSILFPILSGNISSQEIDQFLVRANIAEPRLYAMGFDHNNCGGGCVRMGIRKWARLYFTNRPVYDDRERVENEFREWSGKDVHIMKTKTLTQLRLELEQGIYPMGYFTVKDPHQECIGFCELDCV